jgi:PKHD-type hydroxylase
MLHKYKYWWFKKAIPERICNLIIERGKQFVPEIGITGDNEYAEKQRKGEVPLEIRKSYIRWLDDNWVYRQIYPYIETANKSAGWNYEWATSEKIQFTEYGPNQFYDWHQDSYMEPDPQNHRFPEWRGLTRKLSVTVSLSNPDEYEGGVLQFDNTTKEVGESVEDCTHILDKGSLVVFPSWMWHRVTPVTKGIRYSAVIWALGKPLK